MKEPKRIGRPFKQPSPGQRAPLSLLVKPELKRYVDELARASGRTRAAETEALIEQGIAVRDALALSGSSIPELGRQAAEANFRQRGYTTEHTPYGDIWVPPGHPPGSRSEWYPPDPPEEQQ